MKGKLKTLTAGSFALLFGSAAAQTPICPPMPDCEAVYVECVTAGGDPDICYRDIIVPCIEDMCSYDPGNPGGPSIPPA